MLYKTSFDTKTLKYAPCPALEQLCLVNGLFMVAFKIYIDKRCLCVVRSVKQFAIRS